MGARKFVGELENPVACPQMMGVHADGRGVGGGRVTTRRKGRRGNAEAELMGGGRCGIEPQMNGMYADGRGDEH